MAKSTKTQSCCGTQASNTGCGFKIESVISVDERGQMVLPKDLRERAGIQPGDKMALVPHPSPQATVVDPDLSGLGDGSCPGRIVQVPSIIAGVLSPPGAARRMGQQPPTFSRQSEPRASSPANVRAG